jgi:hypothetical protein
MGIAFVAIIIMFGLGVCVGNDGIRSKIWALLKSKMEQKPKKIIKKKGVK